MNFDASILKSLRHNEHMSCKIALTEMIENAFDHDAQNVRAGWPTAQSFHCRDDGLGVSPKGFEALWTLGVSVREVSRQITGRHGVGFKEAAGWFWGSVKIVSRHQGMRRKLSWTWNIEAERGSGPNRAPVWADRRAWPDSPSFTEIVCDGIIPRRLPSPDQFPTIRAELSHVYRPALIRGRRITLLRLGEEVELLASPWPIPAPGVPRIEDEILTLRDGRRLRLSAMVTAEDVPYPGIHIEIVDRAMDRIDSPRGSHRIYGWAELEGDWYVAKNKTAITDDARPELEALIRTRCAELFKAAEQAVRQLTLDVLVAQVNDQLNGLVGVMQRPGKKVGRIPGTAQPGGVREGSGQAEKTGESNPSSSRPLIDDPDDKPTPESSRAPVIEFGLASNLPGQRMVVVERQPKTWRILFDQEHPIVTRYFQEPLAFGKEDPTRIVVAVLHALAALAVTNEDLQAACPFLEGTSADERYVLAANHFFQSYLLRARKKSGGKALGRSTDTLDEDADEETA